MPTERRSIPSRVIALEEAFLHPKVWELFSPELQRQYAPVKARLSDIGPARIKIMDDAGIDLEVLSHVQPGIQLVDDPAVAIAVCTEVNDWLGDIIRTYPTRFAGFAMLPTQSPVDAAAELERTVTQLGFKGALINGHTHGVYLDDPSFGPLLAKAEALDVPIYIHPTDPPAEIVQAYYGAYAPTLVPGWGWPVETGTHVLRMIAGGVFDRYPHLKIIIGHMGELLPYCLTRLNVSLTMGGWLVSNRPDGATETQQSMQKNVNYYLRNNVFVTSSGVFDQTVFECARAVLGIDNLLFSVDAPLRDSFEATEFLRACDLDQTDMHAFAHVNAERLLKLAPHDADTETPAQRVSSSWASFGARTKSKVGRALISTLMK
jgi:predicted TIM-barrel fold metal-dependent hydrolase